ncbi:MAG: N-acetyltransferase [Phaeodactylibacter sp.]|nr:N-acetyltransferase [Phaeodactylibacter sp.]
MKIQLGELKVRHDRREERFYISFEEYQNAVLEYEERKDNQHTILDFRHTFVPKPLRNQGIATRIVTTGMEYARDRGLKVKATCPFVKSFLGKHEAYAQLEA